MQVKKGEDQEVSGESIGKELDKVDAKKDPQKVVQLVNSVTSIINYGNQSDTGTREERTKVNTCGALSVTHSMGVINGGFILKEEGIGEVDRVRGLRAGSSRVTACLKSQCAEIHILGFFWLTFLKC